MKQQKVYFMSPQHDPRLNRPDWKNRGKQNADLVNDLFNDKNE